MADTFDIAEEFGATKFNAEDMFSDQLQLVKIEPGATLKVLFFTTKVVAVEVHFEKGAPINGGYFHCPGYGCPYCQLREKICTFNLMPVYSREHRGVVILRMPTDRKPHTYFGQVVRYLVAGRHKEGVACITNTANSFKVEHMPTDNRQLGKAEIEAYQELAAKGRVDIRGLYPSYSAEFLKQVPRIKRELQDYGSPAPDDANNVASTVTVDGNADIYREGDDYDASSN